MTHMDLPRVGSPRWRAWLKARAEGWRLDHWLQIEGPKHSNDTNGATATTDGPRQASLTEGDHWARAKVHGLISEGLYCKQCWGDSIPDQGDPRLLAQWEEYGRRHEAHCAASGVQPTPIEPNPPVPQLTDIDSQRFIFGWTGNSGRDKAAPLSAPTPPVPTPKPAPPTPPKRIEDIPVFGEEPANPDPWEGFDPTREP